MPSSLAAGVPHRRRLRRLVAVSASPHHRRVKHPVLDKSSYRTNVPAFALPTRRKPFAAFRNAETLCTYVGHGLGSLPPLSEAPAGTLRPTVRLANVDQCRGFKMLMISQPGPAIRRAKPSKIAAGSRIKFNTAKFAVMACKGGHRSSRSFSRSSPRQGSICPGKISPWHRRSRCASMPAEVSYATTL